MHMFERKRCARYITGILGALMVPGFIAVFPALASGKTGSNTFSANLPGSPEGMAVNMSTNRAYVLFADSQNKGRVGSVSLKDGKLLNTLPIPADVTDLALNSRGTLLYMTSMCNAQCNGSVYVLDTKTNRIVNTISVGSSTSTVVVSPMGPFAFVTSQTTLYVIDTTDDKIVTSITIDPFPIAIAINSTGSTVYVASEYGDNPRKIQATLEVVDILKASVTASVDEGSVLPFDLAVSPSGKSVYETGDQAIGNGVPGGTILKSGQYGVRVMGTDTNTTTKIIEIRRGSLGITFSSNGKYVYIAVPSVGVDVINASTNELIRTISENLGSSLSLANLAVDPNDRFIYATAASFIGNGKILKIKVDN